MGQEEVGDVLTESYPKYLDYKEITRLTGIGIRTIQKTLTIMRKRNEVEYIIVKSNAKRGVWITKYRIRRN